MEIHRLVKMANEIGEFFAQSPDREVAITAITGHLRNFWEPRMRREIIAHANNGGADLIPIAREAIARLDSERKPG